METLKAPVALAIADEQAKNQFGVFAENFSKDRPSISTEQVIVDLQTICSEIFTRSKQAASQFAYELPFSGIAVGESGKVLFQQYEDVVGETLKGNWGLTLKRTAGQPRLNVPEEQYPSDTSFLARAYNKPYTWNYTVGWEPGNTHLVAAPNPKNPLSAIDLLRAENRTRKDKPFGMYTDRKIVFTGIQGGTEEYPVEKKKMTFVPLIHQHFTHPDEVHVDTMNLVFGCRQQVVDWALTYIYSTELYDPKDAPETPPTLEDYVTLARLGNHLRYHALVNFACTEIWKLVNPDNIFEVAAHASDLRRMLTPESIEVVNAATHAPLDQPDDKIAQEVLTLVELCGDRLYKNPGLWQNIVWGDLDSATLVHSFRAAQGLNHATLQQQAFNEIQTRAASENADLELFVGLTQLLVTQECPEINQIYLDLAEQLHIPCTEEMLTTLRVLAHPEQHDNEAPASVEPAIGAFRIAALSGLDTQARLGAYLWDNFDEGSWLSIATVAAEPQVAATEFGGRLLDYAKQQLVANNSLFDTLPKLQEVSVADLGQMIWVGETLTSQDALKEQANEKLVQPASQQLIYKINDAPLEEDFIALIALAEKTGSVQIRAALTTVMEGNGGNSLKKLFPPTYASVCEFLGIDPDAGASGATPA